MEVKTASERRIEHAFATMGRAFGGEFYVFAFAASKFIDACAQESLAIVGVEAFRLEGTKLRPDLSQISDFSSALIGIKKWEDIVSETAAEAHIFVDQMPSEASLLLNFSVVSFEESNS